MHANIVGVVECDCYEVLAIQFSFLREKEKIRSYDVYYFFFSASWLCIRKVETLSYSHQPCRRYVAANKFITLS